MDGGALQSSAGYAGDTEGHGRGAADIAEVMIDSGGPRRQGGGRGDFMTWESTPVGVGVGLPWSSVKGRMLANVDWCAGLSGSRVWPEVMCDKSRS